MDQVGEKATSTTSREAEQEKTGELVDDGEYRKEDLTPGGIEQLENEMVDASEEDFVQAVEPTQAAKSPALEVKPVEVREREKPGSATVDRTISQFSLKSRSIINYSIIIIDFRI